MQKIYRTLIVEDEMPALLSLMEYISRCPQLLLIGSAKTIRDAEKLISRHEIDILFLDFKLRDGEGINVIKNYTIPYIVFCTGHAQFAVTAFEYNAVDFLLKPYTEVRFRQAIEKVINLDSKLIRNQGIAVYSKEEKNVKIMIDTCHIQYFRSEGKQCTVICNNIEYLIPLMISEVALKLGEPNFIRVHRSYLVNTGKIGKIIRTKAGTIKLEIAGQEIPVGRLYHKRIKQLSN